MPAPGLAVASLTLTETRSLPLGREIHGQIHGLARTFPVSHLFVVRALCRVEARDIHTPSQFGRQQVRYRSSIVPRF